MFQRRYVFNAALSVRVFTVLACLLTGACSFRPSIPHIDEQAEKLVEALEKGGYRPARGFAIESQHDVWMHERIELDVEITAPVAPGHYPLVIYLPSLGEDAKAGHLWRESWAKAGYVVFSVQPQSIAQALQELKLNRLNDPSEEEMEAWDDEAMQPMEPESKSWFGEKTRRPSRTARNSELHYLGHEYFATENLKNRMTQLFWAFQQLTIRVGLHQAPYAAIDLNQVVLAGYDLGAQTLSAVLGEDLGSGLPAYPGLKPMAAIVLSPSVNLATGNVRSRFQKLNLPLMVVTGTEDNDPYAVSSAGVRTAIWDYAPVGDKYLLLLKDAGHQLLAGSEMGGRFGQDRREVGGGPGGGMGLSNGGPGGGMMRGRPGGERKNPDLGYKQVAAVLSATTAFLDTVCKHDEFAQSWLVDKASYWLEKAGSLKRR